MRRKLAIRTAVLAMLAVLLFAFGCGANTQQAARENTLFQVSTLNALMLGQYDGVITTDDFLQHGDTGLGTIHRLDGEMITLDGVAYQIKGDGTVAEVTGQETIPFGVIGMLGKPDGMQIDAPVESMEGLTAYLDEMTGMAENPNRIYLVRIDGEFTTVRTRSVPAQQKPYPPLSEVTAAQNEFEFEHVEGTVVGVYFPDYLSDLNMHGWHLHFLSDDRTKGGHLLDASVASGTLYVDSVNHFDLYMPDTLEFAQAGLATDLSEEINAAES